MLKLRELVRSDLAAINAWRADRDTVAWLGAPFRYRSIGQEVDEAWFESYMRGRANCVRCVVVDADKPEILPGLATLASANWTHRTGTFHIQVSPEAHGCGVGGFALESMLRQAVFKDGAFVGIMQKGLLCEEWEAQIMASGGSPLSESVPRFPFIRRAA